MNHQINVSRLKAIAAALSDFEDEMVFVGGATLSVTNDVDVVIELISTGEFYQLQEKLLLLGFQHDINAPIISRYVYQGVKVDFMPTDPAILGFTNRWYKEGIKQKIKVCLDASSSIFIFSSPYYLAAKLEAFLGRGKGDLFASHDLEDIIYLLDHRPTLQKEILDAPVMVKSYPIVEFRKLCRQPLFKEALLGHVEPQDPVPRAQKIIATLEQLTT